MRTFWLKCSVLALSSGLGCSGGESSEPSQEVQPAEPELGGEMAETLPDGTEKGSESGSAQNSETGGAGEGETPDGQAVVEGAPTPTRLVENDEGSGDGDVSDEANPAPDETNPPPQDAPLIAPASVCGDGPFAVSPLTAESVPQAVCTGMNFIEGAVWFSERSTLFFSDIQFGGAGNSGRIYSYTPGGECQPFIENAGTNGLAIAADGNLLGCRHGDQTLTVFDLETQQPSVLVADNNGVAFNSPNDVVLRSDGNLYFTDPNYGLGAGQGPQPTRAYWRDAEGTLTVIDEGGNANGINLSPDESRLYLSHLGGGNDVLVYDVDAEGEPSNPTTFLNVGSDGMAVDCAGNLYITQNGVQIYDPAGALLGTLDTPGAANVAFGGPERRTLYVTAGTTLYTVEMAIPGMPY